MLSFTIGASSIAVFLDTSFNTIDKSHVNYAPLKEELSKKPDERDLELIRSLVTIKKMIERFTDGRVTIRDMEVLFDGTPIANYMAKRMLALLDEGVDVSAYAKFMANVHENPATYVPDELLQWLEKANLPITPDGQIIAFKKVKHNYTDCHTGKFDNSVGAILEMSRDACDPNRARTCSTGFHFCSPDYLSKFRGERVMVVKVNPADITSIPSDYQFTKGRTCRYEVIAELASESAAKHKVWDESVICENEQEFPDDVVVHLIQRPAPEPVVERQPTIEIVRDGDKLVVGHHNAVLTFTTTGGNTYTADQLLQRLQEAGSKRAAAKSLGIQDSTLRGWLKRIQQ